MRYRQIAPTPGAAHHVAHYWILEADSASAAVQRIVPDGHPEMIINLGDPFESLGADGSWREQPQACFAGQLDKPLLVRASGRTHVLGIRLRPWGARAILKAPQQEFASQVTPLEQVLRDVPEFNIAEIDRYFGVMKSTRDCLIEASASRIATSGGQVELGQFAADAGISIRQWERRFLDAVGLPPKVFCRIQRFQRVLKELGKQENWADAALRCGYYDQAHLIRDFRDLAGQTPARLTAAGSDLAWEMSHFYKTRCSVRD